MNYSEEDFKVIEHVVLDDPYCEKGFRVGEAWIRRVIDNFGTDAENIIAAKIQKHRDAYFLAVSNAQAKGMLYKNAAEREQEAKDELAALRS